MQRNSVRQSLQTSGAAAAERIAQDLEKLRRLRLETARLRGEFLAAYRRLWSLDMIRTDPLARRLMSKIARTPMVEQMHMLASQLAVRVADLQAQRMLGAGRALRPHAPRPARLLRESEEIEASPRRTILRM